MKTLSSRLGEAPGVPGGVRDADECWRRFWQRVARGWDSLPAEVRERYLARQEEGGSTDEAAREAA